MNSYWNEEQTNIYTEAIVSVAETYFPDQTDQLFIATGLDFPDALAGSLLAARQNSGMLLVPGTLEAANHHIVDFIVSRDIASITVFGGNRAVSLNLVIE